MAEFAAVVASLVGPAIELGNCIVAPIKRQFNYLCCFNNNIQNLRDEAKKLDDVRAGLQTQAAAAENNVEVIVPEVKTWLASADAILVKMSRIEIEVPIVQSGCSTSKSRFSLSRKAKKTIEAMKELREQCKFSPVSQPAPSAATVPIPLRQTYDFDSRKQIEEDIMIALTGKKVDVMGICGMGGVGKTTMAKRIMNRVMEERLFDKVVMVVVGQQVDMLKIQCEIAELLGLKLEVESLSARAHKLRVRLTSTKRTLVVLDDVWESFKLEDLGIPCESSSVGCTVLLTSRDICSVGAMDAQMCFTIQVLSKREAWFLFKEKVGTCVDNMGLHSTAQEVVKKCKGLPIAIITVARALKDKKNKSIWEDALQQLKSSNPVDIPHFLVEVYNPLKLSYDFLDNLHARSLFLLCSLFPEDHGIPLEQLAFYSMGLRTFEGLRNLEDARNRVYALVEMLKSRFLLLDGMDEHYVKMHDVVRDVARFIASKEGRITHNLNSMNWSGEHCYSDCTWISLYSNQINVLPMELIFPSLRLMLIHTSKKKEFLINDHFFEGMSELNVLFISSVSFGLLPQTMQLLKNLRTLYLDDCMLKNIYIVGELLSLEILICHDCNSIEELPAEIGKLNRLRLLEISHCWDLRTIAPGVISKLVQLEDLKIADSFDKWETVKKGKGRKNAALSELEALCNLTCLEIDIEDYTLATEHIRLSPKILKYDIRIAPNIGRSLKTTREKKLLLELPREIILGHWILTFLMSSEVLCLEGDGSNNLDLSQAQNLKSLTLEDCSTVKKLVSVPASIDWGFGVFPLLESLCLSHLPNLEEMCDGTIPEGSNSFENLKRLELRNLPALKHLLKHPDQKVSLSNLSSIEISQCHKLHNVFSLAMAKDCLLQLEKLTINRCKMMEEVLWKEENGNGGQNHIRFPKLKTLILISLESLTTFCKGIECIEFPLLTKVEINSCPKLISFVSSTGNSQNSGGGHDDDSFHLFCKPKVSFDNFKELKITGNTNIRNTWCHQIPISFFSGLEKLEITSYDGIWSLFSSSIAGNLVNLKQLTIQGCQEMETVIAGKGNVCNMSLFPNLLQLAVKNLPKLETFCEWRCALELPSLKKVWIEKCPQMKSLTVGSLNSPNLESIKIDLKDTDMQSLNGKLLPEATI